MLETIIDIFKNNAIETNGKGETIPLHSNTSIEQGIFLQKIFDQIKPSQSLEVGFAYGISAMFILEKHRDINSKNGAHIVIEPDDYWGTAAQYNIEKEGLTKYLSIKRDYSDIVLSKLFLENFRIQYAYIDTTKQFDVIMHDFYLINKLIDVGGVIILDDCGGGWPGVQRAARFINTLPNYQVMEAHSKIKFSIKKHFAQKIISFFVNLIPFKTRIYPGIDFSTNADLGLDYNCIAFQKTNEDKRDWSWDKAM